MKRLRSLMFPVACFAIAWAVTRVVTKPAPQIANEPAATSHRTNHVRRPARRELRQDEIQILARKIESAPPSEWAGLWHDFSSGITTDGLEQVAKSGVTILGPLAKDELAARLGKEIPGLRAMAYRNPAMALRLFRSAPESVHAEVVDLDESSRGALGHSSLGLIFAAWARRDPQAAAAAIAKLPEQEQRIAAGEVALTWAYRDGPAALRFLLAFNQGGSEAYGPVRMDLIFRAAFRTDPAGTAKLLREHASLRKAMGTESCDLAAVRPWFDADPETVTAWLLEPYPKGDSRADMWLLRSLAADQPEVAARLMRALPPSTDPFNRDQPLALIARRDPELALSLADHFGLDREQLEATVLTRNRYYSPGAACDRWLAALRQNSNPDAALAALGGSAKYACELANHAAAHEPELAAQLAKLVPASALLGSVRWNQQALGKFWPEIAEHFRENDEREDATSAKAFPDSIFQLDPAIGGEYLITHQALTRDNVTRAIEAWAPYDFAAAEAWLNGLPADQARQAGELSLMRHRNDRDPATTLAALAKYSEAPDQNTGILWQTSLRRLMIVGGDWQSWLAKMPEGDGKTLVIESLTEESKLLDLLKKERVAN